MRTTTLLASISLVLHLIGRTETLVASPIVVSHHINHRHNIDNEIHHNGATNAEKYTEVHLEFERVSDSVTSTKTNFTYRDGSEENVAYISETQKNDSNEILPHSLQEQSAENDTASNVSKEKRQNEYKNAKTKTVEMTFSSTIEPSLHHLECENQQQYTYDRANSTSVCLADAWLNTSLVIGMACTMFVIVIGGLGNTFTLLLFFHQMCLTRHQRSINIKSSTVLICNLAIADFCYSVLCLPAIFAIYYTVFTSNLVSEIIKIYF